MVDPDSAVRVLARVHQALDHREPLEKTLDRVVELSVLGVPGCDQASITVIAAVGPATVSHSGPDVEAIDAAQYAGGGGPCLEAVRTGEVVELRSIAADDRWPLFGQEAANRGMDTSLSLPLRNDDEVLGSINLYGRSGSRLDGGSREMGILFAEQVAIALANVMHAAELASLVDQLREALNSRDLIGQAKGILMAQRQLTADDAFELLRTTSQHLNRKLRDIAGEVTRTGSLPTS